MENRYKIAQTGRSSGRTAQEAMRVYTFLKAANIGHSLLIAGHNEEHLWIKINSGDLGKVKNFVENLQGEKENG